MKFPNGVILLDCVPVPLYDLLDGTLDSVDITNIKIRHGSAFAGVWGETYFVIEVKEWGEVIFLACVGKGMVTKMRLCIETLKEQGYTHFTAYTTQPKVARLFGRLGFKYRDIIMSNIT